jgi:acetyl-CoA C-acetyltransferase
MSKVSIIGAYNTKFGSLVDVKDMISFKKKIDTKSFYDLIIEAGRGAIADSGLAAKDIDAVWIGACSPSKFVNQEHVAPHRDEHRPVLRFKPMTRTEAACASSSVAIYDATYAVEAGPLQERARHRRREDEPARHAVDDAGAGRCAPTGPKRAARA